MFERPKPLIGALPPVLFFTYGMACAFWPMLRSGFTLMQVDPADSRHLNYVLEHGHRWLTTSGVSLWSPAFFFPEKNVSAFTELLLGVLPFYSAFRLVGLAPDSAFQAWMLAMVALTFVMGWLLFRRALGFEPLPAALGAFIVTFGSVRMCHLNHQHLLPHFFTLLAAHSLVRLFRAPARPRFWLFAFTSGVVLQLYAGVQMGWFLGFGLGVVALWALSQREPRAQLFGLLRAHGVAVVVCVALAAVALWPLARPYLAAGSTVGFRSFEDASMMMPQVQSWLYQGPHNWLYGSAAQWSVFTRLTMEGEHRIGFGLLTTIVACVVLWRERRRPWLKVLALSALTVALCVTLYRGRVSPWQLVMAVVPGANGIRAVARVALLFLVPVAVALATFVQRAGVGWRRWLVLALAAWCVLEQGQRVPDTYDKAAQRAEVAAVAREVRPDCAAFFYAPVRQPRYEPKTQLDAMWAQLETGVPTVNGYSSNFPRGWGLLEHAIEDEAVDVPRLRAALARWAQSRDVAPESICFVTVGGR